MLTTLALTSTTRILIWVGAMIVVVTGGGLVAIFLRRRYHESGIVGAPIESLSLHTLRQMHAQGGLSDEEFEALKEAAVRTHTDPGSPMPGSVSAQGGLSAKPGHDLAGDPLPVSPQTGGAVDVQQQDKNQSGPGSEPPPDARDQ